MNTLVKRRAKTAHPRRHSRKWLNILHCVADFTIAGDINNPLPCISDGRTRNAACRRNNHLADGYRDGEIVYHKIGDSK